MKLDAGQVIVVLSPFAESETYGTIKMTLNDKIVVNIKGNMNLSKHSEVLCIVVDGKDMFEFYSVVDDIVSNTLYIERPQIKELSPIEKRRFNRIDCEIGFIGSLVSYHNISLLGTGKRFAGDIKNISAGGILLESKLDIPLDMVIGFKLKLQYFVDCTAIVRRSIKTDKTGFFQVGCEFKDLGFENMKTISLYVFRQQLKARQKEFRESIKGRIVM